MSSNQRISPRVFCIPFSRRRVGLFFYAPDILYTLRPSWFMLAVLQRPWALCVEFSRAVSESVRSHTPVYISRGLAVCRARVKKNFFHRRHDYFHFFFFFFWCWQTPPSPPQSLLHLVVSYSHACDGARGGKRKKKKKKKKENGEGISRRARERAGRETELIIQIQSLKGKCVFQAVKMINGWEQILTNALV